MTLDPHLIWRIGRSLHGDHFVNALARDLGMGVRSLQRILAGERDAPAALSGELLQLLDNQRSAYASELGLADGSQISPAAQTRALAS